MGVPGAGSDTGHRVGVVVVDAARLIPCAAGRAVHVVGLSEIAGSVWDGAAEPKRSLGVWLRRCRSQWWAAASRMRGMVPPSMGNARPDVACQSSTLWPCASVLVLPIWLESCTTGRTVRVADFSSVGFSGGGQLGLRVASANVRGSGAPASAVSGREC